MLRQRAGQMGIAHLLGLAREPKPVRYIGSYDHGWSFACEPVPDREFVMNVPGSAHQAVSLPGALPADMEKQRLVYRMRRTVAGDGGEDQEPQELYAVVMESKMQQYTTTRSDGHGDNH